MKTLWKVNAIPAPLSPAQMRTLLENDIKANLEIIKAANIKLE
jgi:hypothetical protein